MFEPQDCATWREVINSAQSVNFNYFQNWNPPVARIKRISPHRILFCWNNSYHTVSFQQRFEVWEYIDIYLSSIYRYKYVKSTPDYIIWIFTNFGYAHIDSNCLGPRVFFPPSAKCIDIRVKVYGDHPWDLFSTAKHTPSMRLRGVQRE